MYIYWIKNLIRLVLYQILLILLQIISFYISMALNYMINGPKDGFLLYASLIE